MTIEQILARIEVLKAEEAICAAVVMDRSKAGTREWRAAGSRSVAITCEIAGLNTLACEAALQ